MGFRRMRIVLAILAVASLTLVILDLRGGNGPMSSARSAVSAVVGVFQGGTSQVFSPLASINDQWGSWRRQAQQIDQLSRENAELRAQVRASLNDRARADDLDALLRVSSRGRYRIAIAEVISVGPAQEFSWTVSIDAGSLDGVKRDMSVVNGDGLVGRIIKVNPTSSTVLLLVDASSSVGGRVATTEEIGIVSGTGRQDSLDFQLLDPLAELVVGDSLVTFGSRDGRPYVPGVPIGEVVGITGSAGQLTRIASVRPFVDVSRLSVVGVIVRPPREDPRDSVLPPRRDEPSTIDEPAPEISVDPEDLEATPPDGSAVDDGATTRTGDS